MKTLIPATIECEKRSCVKKPLECFPFSHQIRVSEIPGRLVGRRLKSVTFL